MSCTLNPSCQYNPLENHYVETCYTASTVRNEQSVSRTRYQGDPTITAGTIDLLGATNSFADITTIVLGNAYVNSFPIGTSFDNLFKPNIIIGSYIIFQQSDYTGTPLVYDEDYGIYLVTNILNFVGHSFYTVTFVEGQGSFLDTVGLNYSYLSCSLFSSSLYQTIFKINTNDDDESNTCIDKFSLCDVISSINVEELCGGPFPYTGNVQIQSFVYWNGSEYTLTETDFFVGFLLQNKNGIIINFEALCTFSICFLQLQEIYDCVLKYKISLLSLQKTFSEKVLKVINKINFGLDCSKDLLNLKAIKNILILLNNYDTRDIELDTVSYNNITLTEIRKLLNKIK